METSNNTQNESNYNEMYINARMYMMNMESLGKVVTFEEAMEQQRKWA